MSLQGLFWLLLSFEVIKRIRNESALLLIILKAKNEYYSDFQEKKVIPQNNHNPSIIPSFII